MLQRFKNSFIKPPRLAKVAFPYLVWRIPNNENKIYLTFDDGPIPGNTEWILKTLRFYNIKATFFCVGDNVRKYPHLFKKIIEEGHAVGNHTFNHLSGWNTLGSTYMTNVNLASTYVKTKLFRPPYGKVRVSLCRKLSKNYKIIMWDVLSLDYDQTISGKECFDNVMSNTSTGSIIVFHDNIKAKKNLYEALPMCIEHLLMQGYTFDVVD